MKHHWKRYLSGLLCLAMVLSMLPVAVFASGTTRIYCDAPDEWTSCNVYWWGSQINSEWPGEAMTLGEDGIWYFDVPSEATQLIFNDYGLGEQTDDLIMPTDEYVQYDVSSRTWELHTDNSDSIEANVVASGACGDNVTWMLDENGMLTISGVGAMDDYGSSSAVPWSSYRSQINTVTVETGVTSIGHCAFDSCTSLTSVVLPDGLISIGSDAFYDCDNLTSVTLPEGLTSIGNNAFYSCDSLTSVDLPDGLTSIEEGLFYNCGSLTSVTLPAGLTSIGSHAFYFCSDLTSVMLPEGLTSIGAGAFYCCSSLTSVTLPGGLTSIGNYAFRQSGLTSLTLPDGLTSIGDGVFSGCSSLTSVTLPDGLTSIGDDVFSGCSSLTSVTLPDGLTSIGDDAFSGCSSLTSVILPDGLTSIGSYAFSFSDGLTSMDIPKSVTAIGNAAFAGCDDLRGIWVDPLNSNYVSDDRGCLFDKAMSTLIQVPGSIVGAYAVPNGLTSIGESAFRQCSSLTSVTLPAGLTSIGSHAFNGCSSLTSVTLPAGLTSIGSHAFNGCSSLTSVTLPDGLTSIGSNAFMKCTSLTSVTLPAGLTSIEGYTFGWCSSLTSVTLPDGLTSIGGCAFCSCDGLTSVTLPAELAFIGESAFSGCSSLSDVFYCGTEEQWAEISIVSDNTDLTNATIHYGAVPCSHSYEVSAVVSPTCTEQGYTVYVCSACGDTHQDEYVEATGHSYGQWQVDKEPGCETTGSQYRICANCSDRETNVIQATGHSYTSQVVAPTCTAQGYTVHTCSRCGDSYKDSYVEATGHSYGQWQVDKEPGCVTDGSQYRICVNCSDRETDVIQATGHSYTSQVVAPTCTAQGYTVHTCSRCGDSYKDSYVEATGHSYGQWQVDKEPGCVTDGSQYRICVNCFDRETDVLRATGHGYTSQVTSPTCTAQGYTKHTCGKCGHSYEDGITAKLPHGYGDWVVDQKATIYEPGNKHRVCGDCGAEETAQIPVVSVDPEVDTGYGIANFTVVDAQTLEPIQNAQIFVTTEQEGDMTFATDGNGQVSIPFPVGQQMISVYAAGCLTRNLKIRVKAGINEIPRIGLSAKETYEVELTAKEMTIEEIEEAGIDTTDESNQHVVKYELRLEYEPEIDWDSIFYYVNEEGVILDGGGTTSVPSSGTTGTTSGSTIVWVPATSSDDDSGDSVGYFFVPAVNGRPETKIYPVAENFYLIIRGSVCWLKEMLDVEMLVVNNSQTDTLEGLTATLTLPEGLSLAAMVDGEQTLVQQIEKIAEGQSHSFHWYVRGDTAGSYSIEARLQGVVMPFEEEIDQHYVTVDQIQVWAGDAMHLHFEFPNAAYYGEDYPITITLTNVSDITLYNISHMVQIVQGMEIYYSDGSDKTKIETSEMISSGVLREFRPGDQIVFETTVNIFFESEMMEQELEKLIGLVDGVERFLESYKAVKAGVELIGKLEKSVSKCVKALDSFDFTLETESEEKMKLFKTLYGEISNLSLSYSSSGNKTVDGVLKLANTSISGTLDAIASDPKTWLKENDLDDVGKLLKQVKSVTNSLTQKKDDRKFDIFDSLRTAISAIPIRFALRSVIMEEDPNNTTSIPWSYAVSQAAPQYFGVSSVSKYMMALAEAVAGEAYEDAMPWYFQLLPGMDDPFDSEEAIRYIQATEDEIARVKAKDATGKVTFKVRIVRNDAAEGVALMAEDSGFLLATDNETATFDADGTMTFTGDGMIEVTPLGNVGGTMYIEDSAGNTYTYVIDVVEQHDCSAGTRQVLFHPVEGNDGCAVYCCDICQEIMEVEVLSAEEMCEEHSFGEWVTETESTCEVQGLRSRSCTICGYCEYEFLDGGDHSFGAWITDQEASCTEDGLKHRQCTICGQEGSEIVTAIGHQYESVITNPTCHEQGYTTHSCSACGHTYVDHYVTGGHVFSNWKITKQPSCTEQGEISRICGGCEIIETGILDPYGHDFGNWSIVVQPTCEEVGVLRRDCGVCGQIEESTVDPVGHSWSDGTCRQCGKPESVIDPGLTLKYPTLSFEDKIIYNVYYTVSDPTSVVEMGLMLLASNDADATIDDAIGTVPGYVTNGSVYLAKSEGVAAAYMGDTVYFKVYAKLTDGSYAYSTAGGYNAKAYANTVLNGDYADGMKSLVVAMVNYGAEAQLFFGHNTDSLVNSALTDEQKALVMSYDESMVDAVVTADSSKTGSFTRVNSNFQELYPSVSFDGAFSINYYCTPAITVDGDMTLYWWDSETYDSIGEFTVDNATGSMTMTESNGQYWGQVSGIAAKEMDKTYYVSCVFQSEGETITTGIISYSLGRYCEGKAAADGDAQQAFAQATAVYGYYAKQYFASVV